MSSQLQTNRSNPLIQALEAEAKEILSLVSSDADPAALVENCFSDLQELARKEEGGGYRSDPGLWQEIRERLLRAAYASRPYCIRCGVCCSKGSPTLLVRDVDLFVRGVIGPEDVVVIRKSEPVYSNVDDRAAAANEEMIKIREKQGTRTCIFLKEEGMECAIYHQRPLQCRSQECWNPSAFNEIAGLPKLDRKAVLEAAVELWKLIERHEERCSYEVLEREVARLAATQGRTVEHLLGVLEFDQHVREFVCEKFALSPRSMEFFLGRPLPDVITMFGLKATKEEDGSFVLTPFDANTADG
jgi:Fe-S-cluster containining protein